jgi:hypothetical protein
MRPPTVRLHFTDGSHYDTYHNTFLRVTAATRETYRKLPRFISVARIQEGDTLIVPSGADADERNGTLARKENLG